VGKWHYYSESELRTMGKDVRDKALWITTHLGAALDDANRARNNQLISEGQTQEFQFQPGGDESVVDKHIVLQWAHQQYDGIPDLFASLSGPNPADCEEEINIFVGLANALTIDTDLAAKWHSGKLVSHPPRSTWSPEIPLTERLDDINARMGGKWSGYGAVAFRKYLYDFQESILSQRELAGTVASAYEAHRALLSAVYEPLASWRGCVVS
jgi:hypothetical protein